MILWYIIDCNLMLGDNSIDLLKLYFICKYVPKGWFGTCIFKIYELRRIISISEFTKVELGNRRVYVYYVFKYVTEDNCCSSTLKMSSASQKHYFRNYFLSFGIAAVLHNLPPLKWNKSSHNSFVNQDSGS